MEKILIALMAGYVFWIILIGVYMFKKRKSAVLQGRLDPKYFKSYQLSESTSLPRDLKVIENHYTNQFQVPLLFFAACILTLQQNNANTLFVSLAALFVLSRLLHSYIHLGSNKLLLRAATYMVGLILVLVLFLFNLFK